MPLSVTAIMLVDGRPEMVHRAVRSFEGQTYKNRVLLVWDTGTLATPVRAEGVVYCSPPHPIPVSVGELRNEAISFGSASADVIVTWDSDDASHERRIEEQVALLEASGAEVVGFNQVLFWDERGASPRPKVPDGLYCRDCGHDMYFHWHCTGSCQEINCECDVYNQHGEAWLYSNPAPNYAIGASLCFWRSVWARRPFPHLPVPGNRQSAGEDAEWLKGVKCVAVSSLRFPDIGDSVGGNTEPRLICSIHGGNSQAYELAMPSPYFTRAPQFDEVCRKEMAL